MYKAVEITYMCGHTGTQYVPESQQSAIDWFRTQLCPDCYNEALLKKSKEATRGLPVLKGSEKQIAWATTIRASKQHEDLCQHPKKCISGNMVSWIRLKRLRYLKDRNVIAWDGKQNLTPYIRLWANQQTDAGWWIDRRDTFSGNDAIYTAWLEAVTADCPDADLPTLTGKHADLLEVQQTLEGSNDVKYEYYAGVGTEYLMSNDERQARIISLRKQSPEMFKSLHTFNMSIYKWLNQHTDSAWWYPYAKSRNTYEELYLKWLECHTEYNDENAI